MFRKYDKLIFEVSTREERATIYHLLTLKKQI